MPEMTTFQKVIALSTIGTFVISLFAFAGYEPARNQMLSFFNTFTVFSPTELVVTPDDNTITLDVSYQGDTSQQRTASLMVNGMPLQSYTLGNINRDTVIAVANVPLSVGDEIMGTTSGTPQECYLKGTLRINGYTVDSGCLNVRYVVQKITDTNPQCEMLYWFDDSHLKCGYKEFCSGIEKEGKETFASLEDCESALPEPDRSVVIILGTLGVLAVLSGTYFFYLRKKR